MSKIDIDAKLINYSWLMTHCQPGHYATSLGPIFLKIDRQTHYKRGNRFMTSKVDIGPKLIHCDHFSTSPGSKWKKKVVQVLLTGHFIPTDVQ